MLYYHISEKNVHKTQLSRCSRRKCVQEVNQELSTREMLMLTGKSHIVSFLDEELYRCSATAEEGEPGSSRDKIPYRLSNPKGLPRS